MAKTKAGAKEQEAKKGGSKKRRRREVQVVSCPSDFPISSKPRSVDTRNKGASEGQDDPNNKNYNTNRLLDWNDTAHEIRSLGATAFEGQQKRSFQDEQYQQLTGGKKKKHQVPLPIVRGIKKKAAERLERQMKEAKESGTVLPKSLTKKKDKAADPTARIHGPAPSVGFMSKGVLKIKGPSYR